mmetsp:Transcript_39715/g.64484  ORF Transcript_39715/g.64484 Transcript_39715/m.64484 type:complete len:85 (+) Transcript_39715:4593-4847(+)
MATSLTYPISDAAHPRSQSTFTSQYQAIWVSGLRCKGERAEPEAASQEVAKSVNNNAAPHSVTRQYIHSFFNPSSACHALLQSL